MEGLVKRDGRGIGSLKTYNDVEVEWLCQQNECSRMGRRGKLSIGEVEREMSSREGQRFHCKADQKTSSEHYNSACVHLLFCDLWEEHHVIEAANYDEAARTSKLRGENAENTRIKLFKWELAHVDVECRLYRSSFRGYFLILSLLGSILVLAVRMVLFICMIFKTCNGRQLSKLH